MLQPDDVMKVDDRDWDEFKREVIKDELYYDGPGDLLDTAEGREKFCRLNSTGVFRKPDTEFPDYKIWVFNVQGQGLIIKKAQPGGPRAHGERGVRRPGQPDRQILRAGVSASAQAARLRAKSRPPAFAGVSLLPRRLSHCRSDKFV